MRIIYFLHNNPFYLSSAENNRTISIMKTFLNRGIVVEIKCFDGYCGREELRQAGIIEDKVGTKISYWGNYNKKSKIKRFIYRKFIQKKQVMNKLNSFSFHPDDIIFIGNSKYIYDVFDSIIQIKQNYRLQLVHERSEHSAIGFVSKKTTKYDYYINSVIPNIDKFVLMTKVIIHEYEKLTNRKNVFYHLPMTVDFSRFENIQKKTSENYIAYCGTMNNSKDGVLDLIRAFNIIKDDIPNIDLWLIGLKVPLEDFYEQQEFIKDNNLSSRIKYLGHKDRDEIPALLINAKVLALCRPKTKQNQAGFPTKLGEYLATGNPVCITDVGEVRLYLEDQKSAYISNPGDIGAFAENLLHAVNNEKSNSIGCEGKKVAEEYFNAENYSKDLIKFLGYE